MGENEASERRLVEREHAGELPTGDDCKVMSLGSGWTQTHGSSQRCGTVLYQQRRNCLLFFFLMSSFFFFLDANPELKQSSRGTDTPTHGRSPALDRWSCGGHSEGLVTNCEGGVMLQDSIGTVYPGGVMLTGVYGRPWSRAQDHGGP